MKQRIEGSLGCCAKGPIGVISPMSVNMSEQGIEVKWGYCSNVFKTIVKQGVEGRLGCCAKGPLGVISPMSKTRLNQGIEGKWGD